MVFLRFRIEAIAAVRVRLRLLESVRVEGSIERFHQAVSGRGAKVGVIVYK